MERLSKCQLSRYGHRGSNPVGLEVAVLHQDKVTQRDLNVAAPRRTLRVCVREMGGGGTVLFGS